MFWSVVLALFADAVAPDAIAPDAIASDAGGTDARLAVAAFEVDGELVDTRRAQAQARLTAALARGALEVIDLSATTASCADAACRVRAGSEAGAAWVVSPRLTIEPGDRDYALSLSILDARDGSIAATKDGVCELCGFEDALQMIEAEAAGALDTLGRLGQTQGTALTLASRPAGVRLQLDGVDLGTTPLQTRLVAGRHRIVASKPGFVSQTIEVEAIDGVDKALSLDLQPISVRPDPADTRRIAWGGATIGLGVAAVIAGAVLLAIDGDPYGDDCQADIDGDCRLVHGTRVAGIVTLGIGAAATVAGSAVLGTGVARRRRNQRPAIAFDGLRLRF